MIPKAANSSSLLTLIFEEGLYQDLLIQITKDFELSGLTITLHQAISPADLLQELHSQILELIHTNFDGFLQLLYRVDIAESTMQSFELQKSDNIAKKTTFVILQREWKKVYFRKKYS